jgi:hypothetical protein
VVERFQWVTTKEFVDGIALGQVTLAHLITATSGLQTGRFMGCHRRTWPFIFLLFIAFF